MAKKIEIIVENGIVIGYSGEGKKLVIDGDIKGIADSVFENCAFLEEVYIKSPALKTIGKNAFSGCIKLKKIEIEALKASIGDKAFYGCNKLVNFVIPNGAIKIGKEVFAGCKKLVYVVIPGTISVIGNSIFDEKSKTLLLGEKNSEAEKYAQNNFITFKEDSEETRKNLLKTQVVNKDTYKDFEIAGERIRCYRSLLLYQEINEYFVEFEKDFYTNVVEKLPKYVLGDARLEEVQNRIDDAMANLKSINALPELKAEKLKSYFEKQGVYVDVNEFNVFRKKKTEAYENIIVVITKVYTEILSSALSSVQELNKRVINEAESKITGLGYGVIGDATTVALHAIDEYRVERKQRKEAAAEMRKQFAAGSKQINSKADKAYRDFIEGKAMNAIAEAIFEFCDEFKYYLFVELIKKKKMSKTIFDNYDEQKSNEILSKAISGAIDKEYAVVLALKEYPLNIDAILFAIENGFFIDEVLGILTFLGLYNHIKIKDFFDKNYSYIELYNFSEKYKLLSKELNVFLDELVDIKAKKIISDINYSGYDPIALDVQIWNSLVENYCIIYPENAEKFNLSKEQLKGENGQQLLSEQIKKDKEEKLRLKAEQELKEINERKEIIRKEKEEKERKKKKIKRILISIVAIILIGFISFYCVRDVVIPLSIYNDGVELLNTGDYVGAINKFYSVYETKDATSQIFLAEKNILNQAKVGDTVLFGSQKTWGGETMTAIEWIVLDYNGDNLLLLSKYALEMSVLDPDDHFYDLKEIIPNRLSNMEEEFFSIEERQLIVPTNSPVFQGRQLFILDESEINKYFPTDDSKKLLPTEHFLRDYTRYSDDLRYYLGYNIPWLTVEEDGYPTTALSTGYTGTFEYYGYRPAIWISTQ